MAEVNLIKMSNELLRPATEGDVDSLSHVKIGGVISCKFTRKRNYKFHCKWWALINLAYDNWEPDPCYPGTIEIGEETFTVEKNKDTFRKNITVMAGYYDSHFTIKGEPRIVAKSISFGKMKEEEFQLLYSKTVDVILRHILTKYTKDDLETVVQNILNFT